MQDQLEARATERERKRALMMREGGTAQFQNQRGPVHSITSFVE